MASWIYQLSFGTVFGAVKGIFYGNAENKRADGDNRVKDAFINTMAPAIGREASRRIDQAGAAIDGYASNSGNAVLESGRQVRQMAYSAGAKIEEAAHEGKVMVEKGADRVAGWCETSGRKIDEKVDNLASYSSNLLAKAVFVGMTGAGLYFINDQLNHSSLHCKENPMSTHCATAEFNGVLSWVLTSTLVVVIVKIAKSILTNDTAQEKVDENRPEPIRRTADYSPRRKANNVEDESDTEEAESKSCSTEDDDDKVHEVREPENDWRSRRSEFLNQQKEKILKRRNRENIH